MSSIEKRVGHYKNLWELALAALDEETREVYARAVKLFYEVGGFRSLEQAVEEAGEEHVVAFLRHLRDRGLAPLTVRLYVAGVKRLLSLRDERPINWARLKPLLPKKRAVKEGNSIDKSVVRDLLFILRNNKRLLIHFLWSTGLRVNEALSLRRRDFNLAASPPRVTVLSEKIHRPRTVFLPRDISEKLREHLSGLGENDYVFHVEGDPKRPLKSHKTGESLRRALLRIDRLKRDSSGRGWSLTLHSFRRAYETTLVSCGVHPMAVKILLGHSLGIEDSYLRLSEADLAREWQKAEQALRLDVAEDAGLKLEALETRFRILSLKYAENLLLHRLSLSKIEGLSPDEEESLRRKLRLVRSEIAKLSTNIPPEELQRIDEWADLVS